MSDKKIGFWDVVNNHPELVFLALIAVTSLITLMVVG